MKRLISVGLLAALLSGCAAALVGGAFYKGSKTKGQRQEFMAQFQKTNTDRESKELKPLDWCSEAYRFDEGYADNDKHCAKRIKAYNAGDTTALDLGGPDPLQTTTPNTVQKKPTTKS